MFFSFYVQIKHQKGYTKSEIPQELIEEIQNEYKEVRGIESTPTSTPTPKENEVDQREATDSANASYYDRSVCPETYGTTCKTANGELFDETDLTLAHKSMAFGTRVEFEYGGRSVVCRVNDRGPFVAGREFDLSRGCAETLGIISRGVARVKWQKKN